MWVCVGVGVGVGFPYFLEKVSPRVCVCVRACAQRASAYLCICAHLLARGLCANVRVLACACVLVNGKPRVVAIPAIVLAPAELLLSA